MPDPLLSALGTMLGVGVQCTTGSAATTAMTTHRQMVTLAIDRLGREVTLISTVVRVEKILAMGVKSTTSTVGAVVSSVGASVSAIVMLMDFGFLLDVVRLL